jgi:hypothetical protein
VSSISDSLNNTSILGPITQVTTNNASSPVSNTGIVSVTSVAAGANAAVSALGAGSVVSFRAVK